MGRLFTERDQLPALNEYDHNPKRRDWFVGDLDRFKYRTSWITEDAVTCNIRDNKVPRIEVRKYIEQCLGGEVYIPVDQQESIQCREGSWNDSGNSTIHWVEFWFEEESDLMLFILRFTDQAKSHLYNLAEYKHGYMGQYSKYIPSYVLSIIEKRNEK